MVYVNPAAWNRQRQRHDVSERDAIRAAAQYLGATDAAAIEEVLSRVDEAILLPAVVQIAVRALGELADSHGTTLADLARTLSEDAIAELGPELGPE
jgi:hypothetical protein